MKKSKLRELYRLIREAQKELSIHGYDMLSFELNPTMAALNEACIILEGELLKDES